MIIPYSVSIASFSKMHDHRSAALVTGDRDRTLAAHLCRAALVTLFEVLIVESNAQDAAARTPRNFAHGETADSLRIC